MEKQVWVLIDDKVGNANQAITLAKCLGLPFDIKRMEYNLFGFIPNWLRFDTLLGIDLNRSSYIGEPYPDIIISSGRKTATVSNYIKRAKPEVFNIHLMHPDLPLENFDLVALPLHDKLERYNNIKNIVYTIGSPTYINEADLSKAVENFKLEEHLKPPFVALIIGGKTKCGNYSDEDMKELIKKASKLAESIDGSLLITTSRRTTQDISSMSKDLIKVPYFLYDWNKELAKNNPYLAFLGISDYIIITGDSVSMCSDALRTGKPVYIFKRNSLLLKKHIRFLEYLENNKYIKDIKHSINASKWSYEPLREAEKLAIFIKDKLSSVSSNFTSKNS